MGGYGDFRLISGVFPVDEYYHDGAVMDLESGRWREIGNMWDEGERLRLGTVVVVDGVNGEASGIFMLDGDEIFRYFFFFCYCCFSFLFSNFSDNLLLFQ